MPRMTSNAAPFILAFGDSLTAGYGLPRDASFPARLEHLLRDRHDGATVRNAGRSGDTTEGAIRRLPALLASLDRKPDLAIVELGANDLLRGVSPAHTRTNLDLILQELARCGIPTLLATVEAPRFLGPVAAMYDGIYEALAHQHAVPSAPFFPPGVLGNPALVLADRVHPNARAIELVAQAFLPAVLAALDTRKTFKLSEDRAPATG